MRLTFNTEIEFPIVEIIGIKGVVFFDAGNSFNLEDTWCQAGGGRGINPPMPVRMLFADLV